MDDNSTYLFVTFILDKKGSKCLVSKGYGTKEYHSKWYHGISKSSVKRVLRTLIVYDQNNGINAYNRYNNWVSFTVKKVVDSVDMANAE